MQYADGLSRLSEVIQKDVELHLLRFQPKLHSERGAKFLNLAACCWSLPCLGAVGKFPERWRKTRVIS